MADERASLAPSFLRTLQIIVVAMTVGVTAFLFVALAVVGPPGKGPSPPVVTYLAIAMAAVMLATRAIAPGIFVAYARRSIAAGTWKGYGGAMPAVSAELAGPDSDVAKLGQVFTGRTIVAAAMIEGAAMFSVVAFLVEHSVLSLGLAIVLLAVLTAHVPTRARAQRWLEEQTRLLNQERQFSQPT
jgi:hypothetical protein